jgi:GLPGLI family protein
MKRKIFILLMFTGLQLSVNAQQFITKAVIEYEVTSNVKKIMWSGSFGDMLKDQMPTFKTGYYDFTFANDKSIYKFDHWSEESRKVPQWFKQSDEDNAWYCNYVTDKINMQKNIFGTTVNVEDSLPKLKWKITNDSRVIAGFNCRKAVAVMFDSVYVFAFYTDEIMISGGPCSINGLPGMILGVTIPRLYTSWIATKVMLTGVNETVIKPVTAKKYYDLKFLEATILDHTKDWYSDDETENKEVQLQRVRTLWQTLL